MADEEFIKQFNSKVFRNNTSLQIVIPKRTVKHNSIEIGDEIYFKIIQIIKNQNPEIKKKKRKSLNSK